MSALHTEYEVIVLGAGAAGMMCAAFAGRNGARVALLERAERAGKKVLISGGGRCNFTNLRVTAENFLSQNPHFAKSALARYTPQDFIVLVEQYGIAYHEKTLGQLFCDGSARQIVTMLEKECRAAEVETRLGVSVVAVEKEERFHTCINSAGGDEELYSTALVVATGGLSIPKIGATALGYDIARQFGLDLVPAWPALVPLVLAEEDQHNFCDLAGISADAIVTAGAHSFREKLLITHRGLSGPAVLQASLYWQPEETLRIDLAPGMDVTRDMRASPAGRDTAALVRALQKTVSLRLAERWVALHPRPDWTNRSLEAFENAVHRWELRPAGTEGFAKAEVTSGGVDTEELSAHTMESTRVPGLFFIGEVVDVTGQLGGFNFQWAWASAAAAGRELAARFGKE